MAQDLVAFRREVLDPLVPRLTEALAGMVPIDHMMQSILFSVERNPRLLECERPSLLSAAMTGGLLRLPCDGVTGQGALVPFGNKVQFLAMYSGLITLAGRSSFSVYSDLVRKKDDFDFRSGSDPRIDHKYDPAKAPKERGKVTGAYAVFRSNLLPPILRYMPMAEILEARDASASYRSGRADSVWKTDPAAMVRKTPIRRAAKMVPHNLAPDLLLATVIEEQHDLGRHATLTGDGLVHLGDGGTMPVDEDSQPSAAEIIETGAPFTVNRKDGVRECPTVADWRAAMLQNIDGLASTPEDLFAFRGMNADESGRIHNLGHESDVTAILAAYAHAGMTGKKPEADQDVLDV